MANLHIALTYYPKSHTTGIHIRLNYAIRSGLQGSLPLVGMTIRSVFRERGKTKGSGTEKLPYGLNHLSRSLLFSLAPLYRKSIVISTVKSKRQLWFIRRNPSLTPVILYLREHPRSRSHSHSAFRGDLSPAPYILNFLEARLEERISLLLHLYYTYQSILTIHFHIALMHHPKNDTTCIPIHLTTQSVPDCRGPSLRSG